MFVFSLLCLVIATVSWFKVLAAEHGEELPFHDIEQSRISELARSSEESLNCFVQFDQFLVDKWTSKLGLEPNVNGEQSPSLTSRVKDEEILDQGLAMDTKTMFVQLGSCMKNVTKDVKNPGLLKCMKDLVRNELEIESFISVAELFDNTLPLPFLTFFDVRELARLLYQNRTWEKLSRDEMKVFQIVRDYLTNDNSGRDKVFVIDQSCEWKNYEALKNVAANFEDQLKEFKNQVIRSTSQQIAHAIFNSGDIEPGKWISIYKRWTGVRFENLNELESLMNDLRSQKFTTAELCKYATVLASYFAEHELKVLIREKVSPLRVITKDIREKSKSKEEGLCAKGASNDCAKFRELKKSYEEDLWCAESFAKLLSNHLLNSIIKHYANIEPRITYPEIVCKKTAPLESIAVRYCRCVGSFCTTRDVGEIEANSYKLTADGTLVTTRT